MAAKSPRSAETIELLRGYYQDWFIGAERLSDATPFDQLKPGQIDELSESLGFARYRLYMIYNKFTRAINETWLAKKLRILLTK